MATWWMSDADIWLLRAHWGSSHLESAFWSAFQWAIEDLMHG